MRPQEQKNLFVIMRAEGQPYSAIAKELSIGKGTCTAWAAELQEEIAARKAEQLEELYQAYYMTREARIKRLGEALKKIDEAIEQTTFEDVPPDKLLDLKLKYTQALRDEYICTGGRKEYPKEITPASLMDMLKDLLERVRSGEVDEARASKESMILSNLLKAYEHGELRDKLDELEAITGGCR